MIIAFLAQSGGRVVLPEAMSVTLVDPENEARFLDPDGRVLAIFSCPDLTAYQVAGGDGSVRIDLSNRSTADSRDASGVGNPRRTGQH